MRLALGHVSAYKVNEVKREGAGMQVRSPGFEPGLSGWEPDVLTKLDYDRKCVGCRIVFVNLE